MSTILPYATIFAAIVAAYLAFRHQQRLKAFELFYARRSEVLKDIESQLEKLFSIQKALEHDTKQALTDYRFRFYRDGLVLYHKTKGANFGKTADILAHTYFTILHEPLGGDAEFDYVNWVERSLNGLSMLYGLAHSYMSSQMEMLTMPLPLRCYRHLQRWLEHRRERKKHEALTRNA